ncbi:hypothetical protein Y032_0189g1182 [Ancylostoma ceylanicum]|uniref:Uncharacterized protein n=1 Tax=Ancylostoma ceylanicum TaxID=53326 RepID=A0A016SQE9_9BILA|nr:hypothetical protein Y032_0189g1182 [Ancylostoma ceylanicum]
MSSSSTRYVPLMVQYDDACVLPRIRPQKIPKIYPLVAAPTTNFYACNHVPSHSDGRILIKENDHWTRNPRWQVMRVSRSDPLSSCEATRKSSDTTRIHPNAPKSIHLFMDINVSAPKKEKESRQSRKKLPRASPRKLRPSDETHPMARIPEDEETVFCRKLKQVRFNVTPKTCKE